MSKGLLRKIALLCAAVLLFSFVLTACNKEPAASDSSPSTASAGGDSSAPAENASYKVGINIWGSGVPVMDAFVVEAKYTLSVFGCESTMASDDFQSDKELANIQNFCSAGMEGIVMMGAAEATVPQMAEVCLNAKVPFVLYTQIGADADRDKIAASNEYYAGAIDSNMVNEGKVVADMAIEAGCTKAVIIGGNIGDNNMDQRSEGFTEQFTAKGGTVLSEARCTDASECATKAEDMLSAYKDADCLYAMVGDYIAGSLTAIGNLGMTDQIKVFLSCVDKASAEYIKQGVVAGGTDGINLASIIAPTLLINLLDGHPIKDDKGMAPRFQTNPIPISKDNVEQYMALFTSDTIHPVADEILKSLCWRTNPDVSYQTYADLLASGLTLEALLKAHGM